MKRIITLIFAALSVCFGRAQTADVASETFHADTIAVKGHGLVIFDKIPDSMVIAINSAKNCQDITVYNPRNPDVRIDMTFRPSAYLDFSKFNGSIHDVNKIVNGASTLIEVFSREYNACLHYFLQSPLYVTAVAKGIPLSKTELVRDIMLNIRMCPDRSKYKNRLTKGRVEIRQHKVEPLILK